MQRFIRFRLTQELTQYRNVIVSKEGLVNAGITEYGFLNSQAEKDGRNVGAFETEKSRVNN